MPVNFKKSTGWVTAAGFYFKKSTGWATASAAYIKKTTGWVQVWPSTRTYTFSFGNTVHVGTNGYISLDGGQSTYTISSTVDRVLGILPADLEMNSVRWASSSTRFYVFWRGKRYSVGTDGEIQYEVHFINGQDYALIKLVSFPTSTYSNTAYYVDGSRTGYSAITSGRTVGAEYRVYFGTDAAFATSFTEFGTFTDPVWLSSSSVTSGSNDDGYFTIVANQGESSQAPTSVTASSITSNTVTISWTPPVRESRGMSGIQSYDYSLNSGGSWTSTSTNTSVNLTGLTASTSYTVLVRANNYYFTGTNYGTVTFSTSAQVYNPVVWGAMAAPAFNRLNSSSRLRWGWDNQYPDTGDYAVNDITWEWQYSTSNATTSQSATPTGLIVSGTRPRRTGGGLTVGSFTYDNRVSSLSSDYSAGNPAGANEPVTFNVNPRYLRYRGVVTGTNGITYRSNYSAWV